MTPGHRYLDREVTESLQNNQSVSRRAIKEILVENEDGFVQLMIHLQERLDEPDKLKYYLGRMEDDHLQFMIRLALDNATLLMQEAAKELHAENN